MLRLGLALLTLAAVAACSKDGAAPAVKSFVHHPPHGGTPVALGDGDYHLEFVIDRTVGRLDAYVFDDDMEDFVRIAMPEFTAVVTDRGQTRTLTFQAVPNPATGETLGDTALFSARAGWLKDAWEFQVLIPRIIVRGQTFTSVTFRFPEGYDPE